MSITSGRLTAEVSQPFSLVALGLGALSAVLAVGLTVALPAYLALVYALVQLSVIDLAEHRLPNELTLRALLVGAVLLPVATSAAIDGSSLGRAVGGAIAAFLIHLVIHLASPGSFGLGDVKLAPTIGGHLAFLSWDAFTIGLLGSFVTSAIVGLALILGRRAGRSTKIPFGPFMMVGAFLALAFVR